jgi:hypothetical protein
MAAAGEGLFPYEDKMDTLPRDISTLSFKRTALEYEEKISLDGKMLRLLLALDGKKKTAQVALECGLEANTLRRTLERLLELKLIEPAAEVVHHLDPGFFEGLKIHLAHHLGPMAEFLIEDVISGMGHRMYEVPVQRAAELISALAVELPSEEARVRFKKAMIGLIPK